MPRRKRIVIVAVLAAALLCGGTAVAAWLVSGSGPATGKATTAMSLAVTGGTPTATLYPGATSSVYATVNNPNPFPIDLTGASFGTVATASTVSGKTCSASNVTALGPVTLNPVVRVAANGSASVTVPNALQMITTAEDGCQGASFNVQVTFTGQSGT